MAHACTCARELMGPGGDKVIEPIAVEVPCDANQAGEVGP